MAKNKKKSSINNRISRLRRYNSDRFLRVDLTKKSRLELLYLLGRYTEMTSTEIMHKTRKQSRYIYDLLDDLHPPETKKIRLFVWEDLTESEAKQLFSILKPFAEPFWGLLKDEFDEKDVTIDDKQITFVPGDKKKIIIDRSRPEPFVRIYYKEKFCRGLPLIVESKQNKSHVYMEQGFDRRLDYVDLYYDSNDRKVYALNILGFLLLICQPHLIGEKKIREVISNPDITRVAPFLKSWKEFEAMGFNIINELLSIGKDYKEQILRCDSVTLLEFRVTKRYLKGLEDWFSPPYLKVNPQNDSQESRSPTDYEKFLSYKIHVKRRQCNLLLGLLTYVENEHDYCVNSYLNLHPSAPISRYR